MEYKLLDEEVREVVQLCILSYEKYDSVRSDTHDVLSSEESPVGCFAFERKNQSENNTSHEKTVFIVFRGTSAESNPSSLVVDAFLGLSYNVTEARSFFHSVTDAYGYSSLNNSYVSMFIFGIVESSLKDSMTRTVTREVLKAYLGRVFAFTLNVLRKMSKKYSHPDDKIHVIFAGHSLGGVYAQVLGEFFGCHVMTFNAPGATAIYPTVIEHWESYEIEPYPANSSLRHSLQPDSSSVMPSKSSDNLQTTSIKGSSSKSNLSAATKSSNPAAVHYVIEGDLISTYGQYINGQRILLQHNLLTDEEYSQKILEPSHIATLTKIQARCQQEMLASVTQGVPSTSCARQIMETEDLLKTATTTRDKHYSIYRLFAPSPEYTVAQQLVTELTASLRDYHIQEQHYKEYQKLKQLEQELTTAPSSSVMIRMKMEKIREMIQGDAYYQKLFQGLLQEQTGYLERERIHRLHALEPFLQPKLAL